MISNYWQKIKKNLKISLALAKADFSLRIEGNYLGIFWYLLNPLAMFLVIILIKNYALKNVDTEYYAIYLLIGLTGFNFFKQALTNSIKSIRSKMDYLKSINNIPPETLVISGLIQTIFSHFFEFLLIAVLLIYYQVPLAGLLFYPIIFLFFTIFVLGISFIFAAIGTYIYDFDNIWTSITSLILFATPIFYTTKKTTLFVLNPLYYFLTVSRNLIIDFKVPDLVSSFIMITICFISLMIGLLIFNHFKKKFAEL